MSRKAAVLIVDYSAVVRQAPAEVLCSGRDIEVTATDEESCVFFGMPKKAIELNAVNRVLPLAALAGAVLRDCA
jgi:chemotaxis response regulator CheB